LRLSEILKGVRLLNELSSEVDIEHITYNSGDVREGSLFVALKGQRFDGHDFIKECVSKGAKAVVLERPDLLENLSSSYSSRGIEFILVEDSRKALAVISNNFYGRPSEKISVIGVTGTNGKTTTTFLIKSILETAGIKTGLIGTIHYEVGDRILPAPHTTPEAPEFQGLLREMYEAGCEAVVTEVSSHALAQKRVDGTLFERAVFTNLSRDHLDFHRDMEHYFQSKARLFKELLKKGASAIINSDDEYGKLLIPSLKERRTYGIISGDIRALNINNSINGLRFQVSWEGGLLEIESSLTGLINVYNILAAVATGLSMGIDPYAIREGIKRIKSVKGRFQRIDEGQDFLVIVDYAHTPDALKRVLLTAREIITSSHGSGSEGTSSGLQQGRIITVFGCGGDRDRGKRPLMGEIATKLSDFVVITNDNPRSEDPDIIISDILKGVLGENYVVIPDRREAIIQAIEMAEKGDIVMIAGKGHEGYQEVKGMRFPFSDEETARSAIKERLNIHASN
jgi:UDP-N-acetylmuramoyl-L-alanyl-D-glutamate--2,6-diaminopimelate ligase